MPKDHLFPPVAGVSLLVTLTEDTDLALNMLGAMVELAGFELNLVEVTGYGSFSLVGPGTYTGALTGSIADGQALSITVHDADFSITGSVAVGGSPAWGDIADKPATFPPTIGAGADQAVAGNDARLSDARNPTAHGHPALQISDSSAAGRDLLTAADVNAQRLLLQIHPWTVKTANFVAVAGERYQVDCSGGAVTMTLPTGMVVGNEIEVQDATLSWGTNSLTIARAASGLGNKINGVAANFTANVIGNKLMIAAISAGYGVSIK